MCNLKNQIAVITGASSGIGKAIALSLANKGATLCLVGRQIKTLEAVADCAKKTAPETKTYEADLTIDEDIQKLEEYLQRDFGHIDILIHSAGIFSMGTLERTSVEDLDKEYKTNLRAPYVLTHALLPMIKARRGEIVFINSSVGLKARAYVGQYAAMKHALKAIADSLRQEVNADGVRVLSVYLGRTATPMQALMHNMEGRRYQPERLIQPDDIAAVVLNALSLPRTAEVTDINIRPMMKLN